MTTFATDLVQRLAATFDNHGVPADDRLFLASAFDRMIEEDIDHASAAESVKHAVLGADSYEELLQQHDRGHRRNKAWFASAAYEDARPTRKGRALLADLAAQVPDWQGASAQSSLPSDGEGR